MTNPPKQGERADRMCRECRKAVGWKGPRAPKPAEVVRARVLAEESSCWICTGAVDKSLSPQVALGPVLVRVGQDERIFHLAHRSCQFRRAVAGKNLRSVAKVKIQKASSTARGYGWNHQKLRAHWKPIVERGGVACARCGRDIRPGSAWDLGHDDNDRSKYTGPEHARCNRRAGQRKSAMARRTNRSKTPRRRNSQRFS